MKQRAGRATCEVVSRASRASGHGNRRGNDQGIEWHRITLSHMAFPRCRENTAGDTWRFRKPGVFPRMCVEEETPAFLLPPLSLSLSFYFRVPLSTTSTRLIRGRKPPARVTKNHAEGKSRQDLRRPCSG